MNAKKAKALRRYVGDVTNIPNLPTNGLEDVNTRKVLGRKIPANWTADYAAKLARLYGTAWFGEAIKLIIPVYATHSVNRRHSPRWLYRKLKRGS